jgi:hypothetical protein
MDNISINAIYVNFRHLIKQASQVTLLESMTFLHHKDLEVFVVNAAKPF